MKRIETYIGQQVMEWCFSAQAQNDMVALGKLSAAMLGTNAIANGLPCTPTIPASMTVQIGAGELYQVEPLEATVCGTLPADTARQILKQGIRLDTFTTGTFATPVTSGQSTNYLIEAQYQDADISLDPTSGASPVVLQFFDVDNPSQPWSGPNNSGSTSNTFRDGVIAYQIKPGVAANTGSQVTPTPDAGWIGLWVVTVPFGATTLTAGNISQYPGAPVLSASLLAQIQARALINGDATKTFSVAPAIAGNQAVQFSQVSGVVGQMRNLVMTVTAASATATMTADEIVVETALGGLRYCLASFNKTINLATTGAGGMDTGTAPASGYVALYAIFNPATATAALLATNAATLQPNVYGGANMPAGYTASALVSVWRTDSSGRFIVAGQLDRSIFIPGTLGFTTSTIVGSMTALSLSTILPANAKLFSGTIIVGSSAQSNIGMNLSGSSQSYGTQTVSGTVLAGATQGGVFSKIPIFTSQTTYYTTSSSAGTPSFQVFVDNYDL